MKKPVLAVLVAVPLFIWGVWLLAVPANLLTNKLEESFRGAGLEAATVGFRKGLFFSVRAEALDVSRGGRRLLSVEDLSASLDLPSLLLLRVAVPFSGRAAGGALRGEAAAGRGGLSAWLEVSGAELGRLGIMEQAGVAGDGLLSGRLELRDGEGSLRFSAAGLRLVPSGGVPLDMFDSARGMVHIGGGAVEVESVSLEGRGMYARLRGTLANDVFEGKLELMPDEAVLPDATLSQALGQYRVSRGHYSMPISKRLAQ